MIGIDGFEWNVILPLVRAGELQHIAELMRGGHYGLLKTAVPTLSPRLWTTIATGKRPDEHGIEDFFHEAEAGEPPRVYTSEDRRTKAFWDILSDFDVRNDTIGWWATFPAEPVLGTMVAQTNLAGDKLRKGGLSADVAGQVYPAELEDAVLAKLSEQDAQLDETMRRIFGEFPSALDEVQAERWRACRWAFRADATYLQVALDCIARGPAQVTAVYFGGADVVGHRFWGAHDPSSFGALVDDREREFFGDVVRDYYRFLDSAIGQLRAAYGREVVTFIVADHGMTTILQLDEAMQDSTAWDKLPLLTGDHARGNPGVFIAHGPGIAPTSARIDVGPANEPPVSAFAIVGRIIDVCPTLLACVGVPAGRDMRGEILTDVFSAETLASRPPSYVDSHDSEEWLSSRVRTGVQPVGVLERLDQLKSLGYMGGD
jgi:hypothetical protein